LRGDDSGAKFFLILKVSLQRIDSACSLAKLAFGRFADHAFVYGGQRRGFGRLHGAP
jgi:hypothetical protein